MKVLEHIFLDQKFIFKMSIDFSQNFILDKEKLRHSVAILGSKCIGYAKLLWQNNKDFKKSKKNIFHSIRYTIFGIQIAETGKIYDYSAANQYFYQLMADQATEWNEINTVYCKGISRSLHHQLDALLPEKQLVNFINFSEINL